MGHIAVMRKKTLVIPDFVPEELEAEKSRFRAAHAAAVEETQTLLESAKASNGAGQAEILDAQLTLLQDEYSVVEPILEKIGDERCNAAHAADSVLSEIAAMFAQADDEYLSQRAADVKDIRDLYKRSDYVTFHIHCTDQTRGMVDADAIASMKRGIRVINLARGEIVQDDAMIPALETGRVAAYITDFPNNRLLAAPHVVAMPHLGASTPESEQNCAVMAADELKDYLETGNVRNSVNLPAVSMTPSGVMRLCILHKNVPGMLANITTLFGRDGVNVENLSNKSKGDWAYTMVDLAAHIGDDVLQDVRAMEHVVRVRAINW